jgi:plastocyanin
MRKLAVILCTCLALGLVAAGCGGGDDNGAGGEAKTSETKTSEKKKPAASGKTADVTMKDIQFNPKTVTVPVGGTVKWTNDDTVGHDVTGSGFKSGSAGGISGGSTFEHTFDKAGSFKYRCTVHPGMEGTVDVK